MSLTAALTAALPTGVAVITPPVPADATGPCVVVYGGAATPTNRRYGGTTKSRRVVWRAVCVSNTIAGAAAVALLVCDAIDGILLDGHHVVVVHVSDPLEDRDDPSEWRWSSTVEIAHNT